MKKLVSITMAVSMIISSLCLSVYAEGTNPFVDVADDAWYHDEIVKAVETGIINGKTATEFKPDDLLTYGEAVKLAACMNQVYLNGEVTLKNGEPWYKPYADFCKENGIITYEYDYEASATRAGYMEIFANALPDEAFKEINSIPDGSILDVKNNAPYAIYVYKLYRAGVVTGVDEIHNCNPAANILRCEVATIISRMMDEGERVRFDMSDPNGTLKNETILDSDETDGPITEHPAIEVTTEPEVGEKEDEEPEGGNKEDEEPEVKLGEDVTIKTENQAVVVGPEQKPYISGIEVDNTKYTISELTIYKQPEGKEFEEYGEEYELEVQVYGGKAPYTYEWQYNGYRNQKTVIENGVYVKGADSAILVLSVEKENTLLGTAISCKITDSEGATVTTDAVKVYGPFSMPVDESLSDAGKHTLVGRIADGIIRKGDKVSVERNGKIIATGTAAELQMFNKSLDEGVKGDNLGIVFELDKGVRPHSGDTIIKYKDIHVIDTSDIVN